MFTQKQNGSGQSSAETRQSVLKPLTPKAAKKNMPFMVASALVVLAGIATGWLISSSRAGMLSSPQTSPGVASGPSEAGLADEETFRDSAEGILLEGGIDGEGTHHLDRGMGAEKYVYLTSTVIDLQSFIGKKVEIWGETIEAHEAGWLMDVGRVKVLN